MSHPSDGAPATDGVTGFALEVVGPADGVVTIAVAGAVDLLTAPSVSEALEAAQQRTRLVVLDLRQVEFLGSAGLSVLVDAARRAGESDGKLAILATNHAVIRAVQVTGLDALLRLFADPDEAAGYLRG